MISSVSWKEFTRLPRMSEHNGEFQVKTFLELNLTESLAGYDSIAADFYYVRNKGSRIIHLMLPYYRLAVWLCTLHYGLQSCLKASLLSAGMLKIFLFIIFCSKYSSALADGTPQAPEIIQGNASLEGCVVHSFRILIP
jgi:hypothetical protein